MSKLGLSDNNAIVDRLVVGLCQGRDIDSSLLTVLVTPPLLHHSLAHMRPYLSARRLYMRRLYNMFVDFDANISLVKK
jgi:hypothetical protein